MNERIQQLALQAHVTVLTTKGMEDIVDGCYIISPDKLDKFAELIVRECVQTLIDTTPERYASEDDWDRGYARAIEDCVHHIQEHFGVEE